jgi:hypothetical protein
MQESDWEYVCSVERSVESMLPRLREVARAAREAESAHRAANRTFEMVPAPVSTSAMQSHLSSIRPSPGPKRTTHRVINIHIRLTP